MSSSYDASTSYDALDDTVYDIFNLDAYISSLSPSVPDSEPVRDSPAPTSRLKRYPKTRSHPRPSPAVISPPVVSTTSAVATTSSVPVTTSAKPDKGKSRQCAAVTSPPTCPVDASHPSSPLRPLNLPQNSTSALCRCLSVSTSGSHRDGNQGSTNRIYGIWLKSSTLQKP